MPGEVDLSELPSVVFLLKQRSFLAKNFSNQPRLTSTEFFASVDSFIKLVLFVMNPFRFSHDDFTRNPQTLLSFFVYPKQQLIF